MIRKVEKILELLKFMTRDEAAEEQGIRIIEDGPVYAKNFVFDQEPDAIHPCHK